MTNTVAGHRQDQAASLPKMEARVLEGFGLIFFKVSISVSMLKLAEDAEILSVRESEVSVQSLAVAVR